MYGFNRMNIFNYTQLRVSVYKTFEACVEEKQVGTNYFILVLPVSIFNNKTRNKISVNFKFYNNIYINSRPFEERSGDAKSEDSTYQSIRSILFDPRFPRGVRNQ